MRIRYANIPSEKVSEYVGRVCLRRSLRGQSWTAHECEHCHLYNANSMGIEEACVCIANDWETYAGASTTIDENGC